MSSGSGNSQLQEVKQKVVESIRKKYGMGVAEFSRSRYAKELGLSPGSIASYLSPNGVVSFPTLKRLCSKLEIGELQRSLEVIRICTYKLIPNGNTDKAVSQNRRANRSKGKA